MCGIAGYASISPGSPVDPAPIERMLRCVAHRGPDDRGTFHDQGIVLGHRRLSIIDVAGGHQPLTGSRPTTIAAVNGEIYNYRTIHAELASRGHHFRSSSDSEVLAHAYDEWGLDFLDRLDGMFAFALWDGALDRLILARDRIGEKPLYYAHMGGLLIFGSELTAITAHPACSGTIDPLALSQYLALEYVPAPLTMIDGVRKLQPATVLVLEQGEYRVERYWTPPSPARHAPAYEDAVAELRRRLERAVESRLVSDVPLGVFLSGGIDSSTVAALAARAGTLETFAIGFDEPSFDERAYARSVANHIGSSHHEQVLRAQDLIDLIPQLPRVLDEPLGDASILPTLALSRFARRSVTVALGGDGGDELFAGYPMHQAHRIAPWLRIAPRFVHGALAGAANQLPASDRNFSIGFKARTFLRGSGYAPPFNHGRWMGSFTPEEQRRLLSPDAWTGAEGGTRAFDALEQAWQRGAGWAPIGRAALLDLQTYLPNDVLTKVDRASMAVALEVRAPLLAREVVEFVVRLPDSYRMRRLSGKRILRDAVRDLLPPRVLKRPKKGFGMPVAAWLRTALRPLLEDVLLSASFRESGLFDTREVRRLVDEHLAGKRDYRKPLWTLLVFELWRQRGAPV